MINNLNLKLFKWSFFLFSFSFSLGILFNSISIGLLIVSFLVISISEYRLGKLIVNRKFINYTMISFFFIVLFREFTADYLFALEKTFKDFIPFLLFPIIMAFQKDKIISYKEGILNAFVYGVFANLIVNWIYAIYRGIILHDSGINFWFFSYKLFSEPFGVQPIYLGYFYVLAIFIILGRRNFFKNKYLYIGSVFLLCLGVFMLAARNAILSLITITPIYLIITFKIKFKYILLLIVGFLISLLLAIQNPVVKNRLLKINGKGNFYSGTSLRMKIWSSGIDSSKDNVIFGLGKQNTSLRLREEYKKRKMDIPYKENYHSHNLFLQIQIQYGLIGTLSVLLMFGSLLLVFLKNKNHLAICWLSLVFLASITEAMFMRQWGIFSFAFFGCLFFIEGKIDTKR